MSKITEILGLKADASEKEVLDNILDLQSTAEKLVADNRKLREKSGIKSDAEEALIKEKVTAGLTREQAIEVIAAQKADDAERAKAAKAEK
jgi:hypothetical protein